MPTVSWSKVTQLHKGDHQFLHISLWQISKGMNRMELERETLMDGGQTVFEYEVALSFAGEQRWYVEEVARHLYSRGISLFYDDYEKIRLWGKHLTEELQGIYEHGASKVVMFISKEYVAKVWPNHERRAMLSRAVQESAEYVLPVRFDDSVVPGLPEGVFYLSADDYSPAELAAIISEKLGIKLLSGKASNVPPPRSTSLAGEVVFDYSNHDGRFVIGRGATEFETKWSQASDTRIHVYNDPGSIYGVALGPSEWRDIDQVKDAHSLDYTSRCRTPAVGEIVVLHNTNGFYAALKLLEIKDKTRGSEQDELRFEYCIQPNGSDGFSALVTGAEG